MCPHVYNQIDHVFYCFAAGGAGGGWTFSHNVCGPGIGEGGNSDGHYVQVEGNENVAIDHNAFEGPFNVQALARGAHNNVAHQCGNRLAFDDNIVWHAQSRADTVLWGDDCSVDTARANNNLIIEDPHDTNCNGSGTDCPTRSISVGGNYKYANVTANNNTILANAGPAAAILMRAGIVGNVVRDNIAVGHANGGNFQLSSCGVCAGNVASDGSGNISWTADWQNTSWPGTNVANGPNSGSPWVPPPLNYYKPAGIASKYGYQGAIGP